VLAEVGGDLGLLIYSVRLMFLWLVCMILTVLVISVVMLI
jgi:hypothetical protein